MILTNVALPPSSLPCITVVTNGRHFFESSFPTVETHEKQMALMEDLCSSSSLGSKRSNRATNAETEPPREWPEKADPFHDSDLIMPFSLAHSYSFTCDKDRQTLGTIRRLQCLVDILDHKLSSTEHAPVDKARELGGEGVVHGGHEAQVGGKVLVVNRTPITKYEGI